MTKQEFDNQMDNIDVSVAGNLQILEEADRHENVDHVCERIRILMSEREKLLLQAMKEKIL